MLTLLPWLAVVVLLLLWLPGVGLVAAWERRRQRLRRQRVEDALKHLLHQEYEGLQGSFRSLAGALRLKDARLVRLLERMEAQKLISTEGQHLRLTPQGEKLAVHVVRAHRLLERYLADEARIPLSRVHQEAERREHDLTPEQVDRLDAALGHPEVDPHGDPIPTREGDVAATPGTPLTAWPLRLAGRIVHLEDEPPIAYAQLVAEGLWVGQIVRVSEITPERVVLTDDESEYRLAPLVAGNVFLDRVKEPALPAEGVVPLSRLPIGIAAQVVALSEQCQGYTRRRLLDLGFTPGAGLKAELNTFAGDPRAYRIRNTMVALRRDQAEQILVRPKAA